MLHHPAEQSEHDKKRRVGDQDHDAADECLNLQIQRFDPLDAFERIEKEDLVHVLPDRRPRLRNECREEGENDLHDQQHDQHRPRDGTRLIQDLTAALDVPAGVFKLAHVNLRRTVPCRGLISPALPARPPFWRRGRRC